MKQKLTIALFTVFLAVSAQAQNSEESRQAAIAQTKQNIMILCNYLERTNNQEQAYAIRLQIRDQFEKMDQLILDSPLFKTSN